MEPAEPTAHLTGEDDGWCYACGKDNPVGLRTDWTLDDDGVARADFEPSRAHQGWAGVLHGGILATLLDEAMAQAMRLQGRPGATASLSIRYRKPAPTSGKLSVEAKITSRRRRACRLHARVTDSAGTCYAEADGTYVPLTHSG